MQNEAERAFRVSGCGCECARARPQHASPSLPQCCKHDDPRRGAQAAPHSMYLIPKANLCYPYRSPPPAPPHPPPSCPGMAAGASGALRPNRSSSSSVASYCLPPTRPPPRLPCGAPPSLLLLLRLTCRRAAAIPDRPTANPGTGTWEAAAALRSPRPPSCLPAAPGGGKAKVASQALPDLQPPTAAQQEEQPGKARLG